MHLGLSWLFGRSLFTPGDALITRIARQLHSAPLSPRHERYTRQVTAAFSFGPLACTGSQLSRQFLAALLDAGPDLLACETIPCFAEARALARLLIEFPAACAWFSFTAKDDVHLCHGEPLAECAAWLNDQPQVVAVGLNCTAPGHILALIQAIRTATDKPVVVYPNSGETYQPESHDWQGVSSSASFAAEAEHWYAGGARIIGGCCRTTPEHIRAIAAWARGLPRTDFAAH